MTVFDFQDASIKGDPKWASASRFTSFAPIVVIILALLCIVQIVIGAVWITGIQSLSNDLSFGQVIQPLVIPGLSLFNTIPSIHLHILARSNNPLLALICSTTLAVLYLASCIVFLVPCAAHPDTAITPATTYASLVQSSFKRTECPLGSRRDYWVAIVVLQFLSAAGYAVHAGMAWRVRRTLRAREQDVREGRVVVVVDEEAKRNREELARERWRSIVDL